MANIFFKFLILCICLTILLCGCKNKKDSSSSAFSSEKQNPSETVNISSDFSQKSENGSLDPENEENPNGTGVTVEAEKLNAKTGKANGIDVSKWQGEINWKSVKKTGIDFAIIRIGYRAENGTIYKDSYADYNIQQANKAGILIGVYFFSTAINTTEAVAEAKWVCEAIKSYPISYPVVYDCEGFKSADSRMFQLSNSARTDNALAFLAEIEKYGYEGMFYASLSDLKNSAFWDTPRIEQKTKIWLAHYSASPYPTSERPAYSGKFDMWQYTNMGKVSGVNGNTDLVVSYFTCSKAKPKRNNTVAEVKPPAEPDKIYSTVNELVTAKELVNLRNAASTNAKIVGSLKNGETLTRIGVGNNGWSKLLLNEQTVYAITSYLTIDLKYKPPIKENEIIEDGVYTKVNEQVTAKDIVNLRSAAGTNAKIVGSLKNGETLTRISIGNNGWSKLLYNGQTVYAVTSYLTTDLQYKPPVTENPTPSNDGFTEINEQVTAKQEVNLRTEPSSKSTETVVHTLKNGEYVTRIGINTASGWSKLLYNGQTVYAISSYLTN